MRYSFKDLYKSINRTFSIKSDMELDINRFVEDRENNISDYIEAFVSYHEKRLKFKNVAQYIITIFLMLLIVVFAVILIISTIFVINGKITNVTQIVTIFSSIGSSFIASVFSLLHIVVKYLFPQTDDTVGTDMLKTTLSSDLKLLNYKLAKEKNDVENKGLSQSKNTK